ncbi:hypothetical protein JCM11641_007066 [Rhodosporidiobolus odoratus]
MASEAAPVNPDLERQILASISSALDTSTPLPPGPTTAQPEQDQPDTTQDYTDGDLPDFSDTEPDHDALHHDTLKPRLGPPSAKSLKGPPGKGKKIPLSALKNRIQVGGAKAKAAVSKPNHKPLPSPPTTTLSTPPSTSSGPVTPASPSALDKGKGKARSSSSSKSLKLSPAELDKIAAKIKADNPSLPLLDHAQLSQLLEQMEIDQDFVKGKKGLMGKGAKDTGSYKFWKTQPVVSLETKEEDIREGPLEPDSPLSSIPTTPTKLHKDFEWVTLDLTDKAQLKEVYELLTHHYVEDQDASFRFDYSEEFIEWALKPPGYVPEWHVGIRLATSEQKGKLVGFISGVPMDLRVRNATKRNTEINFLCVHKKLRSKRLAPLLIQEVTRRTHLKGIFQALYTAGTFLPTPVSRCQYYHRNLNPPKLVKLGFSAVPRNYTVARMSAYYKVGNETITPGLREIERKDLKACARLLRAYLARFDMAPLLSNKEVEHALWAGRGRDVKGSKEREGQVVWTYVVEDPETHAITSLFSLYSLPSTAVKHSPTPQQKTNVNAAYLYYYATSAAPSCSDLGDGSTATLVKNWKDETKEERVRVAESLKGLMGDALVVAQKLGFDVLNALTLQDNSLFLEDLKFGKGDGFLHFYLYNYATKPILGGIDKADGGSGQGVVML